MDMLEMNIKNCIKFALEENYEESQNYFKKMYRYNEDSIIHILRTIKSKYLS